MLRIIRNASLLIASLFLVGCRGTFNYPTPAQKLNSSGPTIAVLPISDARDNKEMDKAVESGYLNKAQLAIADELASINTFSAVVVVTNQTPNTCDLRLVSQLHQLDWMIPDYGKLKAQAFTVGLLTGVVGGSIWLSTGVDVIGNSKISFQFEGAALGTPFQRTYESSTTNRLKKAVADSPNTKANTMAIALQKSLEKMKSDIGQEIEKSSITPAATVTTTAK